MLCRIPTFLVSFLLFTSVLQGQEWKQYTANDAVKDIKEYHGQLWIISGSGLTRLDISTQEKQSWNLVNSDLPDYYYNKLTVDSSGIVWMGLTDPSDGSITRFDGQAFETLTTIDGKAIHAAYDMEVTPDGKTWVMANTYPNSLYVYDQSQFTSIPLPNSNLTYHRNGLANICAGMDNHVWAVLRDTSINFNYIGEFDGSSWILHNVSLLHAFPEAEDSWALDQDGHVYLFCKDHDQPKLIWYDGQTWSSIPLPPSAVESEYVSEPLSIDHENHIRILLSTNSLLEYDGNQWNTVLLDSLGFDGAEPEKLHIDNLEHWWIIEGYESGYYLLAKLYHNDGTGTKLIDLSNSGLPSNELYSMFVDELNNKWMQSSLGLLKYDGTEWHSYTFPEVLDLYSPFGSDRTGGVWLETFNDHIGHFDGVAPSAIPVLTPEGGEVEWVNDLQVDQKGRVMASSEASKIMVFDHGQTSYLPQIERYVDPEFSYPEYPSALAFNPNGTLYALGSQLYRFEADSSWTQIPLWSDFAYAVDLTIAPDSTIWVNDYSTSQGDLLFNFYDGTSWTLFDNTLPLLSEPKWDINGNPWFKTTEGLCKYANQTWTCYNRLNSPIVAGRMTDFSIDEYNNIWIVLQYGGLLELNEDAIVDVYGEELPKVSGQVYRDVNHNSLYDLGDTPLAYQRELLLPDSVITFSQLDGNYHLGAAAGDHQVKYIPRTNWHIDNTPGSYDIQVANEPISDLNFALAPDEEQVNLSLFLAEGLPRCNSLSTYTLSYTNWGTSAEDVRITFVLDDYVTAEQIYPQPDIISGDTLIWYNYDLVPFTSSQIRMDLQIPGVEHSSIFFTGYIDRVYNKVWERVDSLMILQNVRCSFDPNDKISRTARVTDHGQSFFDDPINYTIRFQNTGNDTAFLIIVRDTLDVNLDLNTLEILAASHPYEAFLKPDRTLEFRFYNIDLPDSTTNELGSHGFVSYRISAKAGLASPTVIQNTAHIYFDYNGSIQTNTAVNELIDLETGSYDEVALKSLLNVYPNPAKDELMIESVSHDSEVLHYQLVGITGEPILSGILQPGEVRTLSISALPAGVYMLNAKSDHTLKSVIVVKGN